MSKIGELIYNIHQYGNSKFYMPSDNPNAFNVLDFLVDNNGNLNMNAKIEVFDRPYLNNGIIDSSAVLEKTIETAKYSDSDLQWIIELLIIATFHDYPTFITRQEKSTKLNTADAVKTISEKAQEMLQLSNSDLTLWVTGMRANSLNLDYSELDDTMPNTFDEICDIEKQVHDVFTRLMNVRRVWQKMNNSQSQDEYDEIGREWDILYSDKSKPSTRR